MNQHTAKLLKKYARAINQDFRQVKKWWETLNWQERTAWRVKINAIIGEEDVVETETVETTNA